MTRADYVFCTCVALLAAAVGWSLVAGVDEAQAADTMRAAHASVRRHLDTAITVRRSGVCSAVPR